MSFLPHYSFDKAESITPDVLKKLGVGGVILDTDNTLTNDGSQTLAAPVKAWLDELAARGIKAVIVSNNSDARVRPFAALCGLPYVAHARKPLRASLADALAALGTAPSATAVIGDQLFTDMAYARRCGLLALRVEPIGGDIPAFVRFKRVLERPFLSAVNKRRWRDA